jgi:hypothetical protein
MVEEKKANAKAGASNGKDSDVANRALLMFRVLLSFGFVACFAAFQQPSLACFRCQCHIPSGHLEGH